MKFTVPVIAFALAGLIGCSNQSPDVTSKVKDSLKQAGLNNVTVSQDRDKGVVTLGGTVNREAEKGQAEEIAKSQAGGQLVADQIAVAPDNNSADRSINSDLDKGIESNLDAAMEQHRIKGVHHSTTNGVVKLTGDVNSNAVRTQVEHLAAAVPNVQQVVDEVTVNHKEVRATSTPGTSADRSKMPEQDRSRRPEKQ